MSAFDAAAGGGPATFNSQGSTGSVAVLVVDTILQENNVNIFDDAQLDSQSQANVAVASVNAIGAAINKVEESRHWQEIVALIKVYGGWAGAALAVAINAYLAVSTNTIQGLIAALPGMLLRILSDPNIPGYVASSAINSVKATAAIVFLRALISYLSFYENPSTIGTDINALNDAFIKKMVELNPNIQEDGIDQHDLDALRQNQLKLTTADVTRKAKLIVDAALNPATWKAAKETIGRLCEVPFTYVSTAGTMLATYATGLIGNLQEYVENRDDILSIASESSLSSHTSLWNRLLPDSSAAPPAGEPVAGGGPAEKQVQLVVPEEAPIQAKVLQVVLRPGEVEETEKEIDDEIDIALAGGSASGGLDVPSVLEFRDRSPSMFSDFTDTQKSMPYPDDNAAANTRDPKQEQRLEEQKKLRLEEQKKLRQKLIDVRRGKSEPANSSEPMGGFRVSDYNNRSKKGPVHPFAEELPSFSQPEPGSGSGSGSGFGGKKRKTRKTKKAKRTKKRSKKSSKRKTRR